MELAQLGPRLEPELIDEESHAPVRCEGVRLPAAAVEREHQLRVQTLAPRMLAREPLQLGDELRVAARRQLGLHPQLDDGHAKLLQAPDLRDGERGARELGQRRSSPERQRGPQQLARALGLRSRQRPSSRTDLVLEPSEVELLEAHVEAVSGRRGHHDGGVAERCPEARHVDPDRPHRVRLHVVAPQRGSQPFSAHGLVGVEEQDGQHGTRLGAAQRDRSAVVHHFERPE